MDESSCNVDLHGNLLRVNSVRAPATLKTSLYGRSSARNSSSFRRSPSNRTPRRDSGPGYARMQWIWNNRVVFWLMLITLWAYVGFHVQSRWAHSDHQRKEFVGYENVAGGVQAEEDASEAKYSLGLVKERTLGEEEKSSDSIRSKLSGNGNRVSKTSKNPPKKRGRRMLKKVLPKAPMAEMVNPYNQPKEMVFPNRNTSFGLMVGPFGDAEDRILEWSPAKRRGTCDRKGAFERIVWSRTFVLLFHELSMTGAPLSMMELASELLSCGGYVKVVVLSKKGGLMSELNRRGINILEDKGEISFKAAMKADLVIAGSAVSSSWIEQYLRRNPAGSSQLVWWIMENRKEYFIRSRTMLSQVKMLAFLSDVQSKQWLSWCEEENIKLKSQPMVVPLSTNDELAFVAGIPCTLNTPAFSPVKMTEKRGLLRAEVRKEMGLSDKDMLVMTLSSVNPTKGQLLLLEAARLVSEGNVSRRDPIVIKKEIFPLSYWNQSSMTNEQEAGDLHLKANQIIKTSNTVARGSKKRKRKRSKATKLDRQTMRKSLSEEAGSEEQGLKILIGSIGSKSNKVTYVKALLKFLSGHSNMSKIVLWTRATTRVASLYAAADVYVINSQGLGETFGRVTIEAMAFGLPVLGTDAGGTREIVEDKVTGLLHPPGREGTETLAQNIHYLLKDQSTRKKMGMLGRQKVHERYLKKHTYSKLGEVFAKCMKVKE